MQVDWLENQQQERVRGLKKNVTEHACILKFDWYFKIGTQGRFMLAFTSGKTGWRQGMQVEFEGNKFDET